MDRYDECTPPFTTDDVFYSWKESHSSRKKEMNRYDSVLKLLHDAIHEEGVNPSYHRRIMKKHRRQWPTLWFAIDQILKEMSQD